MKIHKVVFKNINSLKGEHIIDFEDSRLTNAGLILITGPTGSGKSTILDVITLALYNKIPRFGSISKNEMTGQGSIITHHTKDAYAEVFYSVNNVMYASKWSIAYNRNNNLNDYNMELWNLNNSTTITDKKGEIPEANEKIIGLNYDQFIKSILLSQGEFAQFLKAKHEERALLLERITGSHIYRNIGKLTFEKHKTAKENIEKEYAALQHIEIKSDEALTSILEEIQQLNAASKNLEQKINELTIEKNKIQAFLTLQSDIETLQIKLNQNEVLKSGMRVQKIKLDIHNQLTPHREGLIRLINTKKEYASSLNQKTLLSQKLESIKKELAAVLLSSGELLQQPVDENNVLTSLSTFEHSYSVLEKELAKLKEEGEKSRADINAMASGISPNLLPWFKPDVAPAAALQFINGDFEQVSSFLKSHNIADDTSIVQLLSENEKINNLLIFYREANRLSAEKKKEESAVEENEKSIVNENKNYLFLTEAVSVLEKDRAACIAHLNQLRKEKIENFKKAELSELRETLVENEACPLCGSTHHPYKDHHIVFSIGETEVKINEAEKKLDKLQEEETTMIRDMASSSTRLIQYQELSLKKKQYILSMEEQLSKLTEQGVDMNALDKSENALGEKLLINNNIIQAIEKKNTLNPLRDKYERLSTVAQQFRELKSDLNKLTKTESPLEVLKRLRSDFQKNQQLLSEISLDLKEVNYAVDTLHKEIQTGEVKLLAIVKSLGFDSVETALTQLLEESEFVSIQSQIQNIESEGSNLTANLNLKKSEMAKFDLNKAEMPTLEQVENLWVEINKKRDQNYEKIGVLNQTLVTDENNRNKLKHQKESLLQLEKDLRKWELLKEAINADANGKNYSNFAQELTLQQIIVLANKRLTRLSDRYLLTSRSNDLFIVDLYQANIERSVKTLSGGESFIVSLALALSLSDLASQNIKLDCLFIDEGFGTLDSEMLDVVISTLEKLQSESEKTIGIISHVDSLRDRIVTQIKLHKNHQGYSTIDIGFVD